MKNSTKFILVFVFLFAAISHNQYGFAQSSNVTLVGHISDGSNLTYQNLTKFGNSVYIVERNVMWSGGVGAYNVSNPNNPQMINFYYGITTNAQGASKVVAKGSYLYITLCDTTFLIYDVSNPPYISPIGYFDSTGVYAQGLQVQGNYAYLCCGAKGVWVINIQNPASPQLVGTCALTGGLSAMQLSVSGNYAYVTDDVNRLHILNISNPTAMAEVGAIQMSPPPGGVIFVQGVNITVQGNYAYVANPYYGFQIFNISNPAAPTAEGSYLAISQASDVSVSGNHAYIADYGHGLQVIDISNPANPTQVGYYYDCGGAIGVYAENNRAYVSAGFALYILDFEGCNLQVGANVTNASCDTCHDGSATAIVTNGAAPFSYTWNTSPIQTTQTITGLSYGTYSVCVVDNNGCHACNNSIYIDSISCTGFSASAYSVNATCSTCNDGKAWANVSGGTPPYAYTWYTSPMQTTDTAANLSPGTYGVCITDHFGCTVCDSVIIGTGSCSAYFDLYPDANIPHQYYAVNMASGVAPISYMWNFGDGTTSNQPYPTHIYAVAGFYSICLTIADAVGCTNTYCNNYYLQKSENAMVTINVVAPSGISEHSNNQGFSINPNPASDIITITTAQKDNATIKIYSLLGELKSTTNTSQAKTDIDISKLAAGVYIIEVVTDKSSFRQKFIKE